MKVYFDSSAFAKRFIEEGGSQKIDEICGKASAIGLSIICLPEIISALNRRLRENDISSNEYALAKSCLYRDTEDAEIINITDGVVAKSEILLEKNVLRAMDALHIASAIEWDADLFVTADNRQEQAAKNAGLSTELSL